MSIIYLIINLIKWVFDLPMILAQFLVDLIEDYRMDKKGFKLVAISACVGLLIMIIVVSIGAHKASHRVTTVPDTDAEPIITEEYTTAKAESPIDKMIKNSGIKKLFDIE